jgi:hypothetical protein
VIIAMQTPNRRLAIEHLHGRRPRARSYKNVRMGRRERLVEIWVAQASCVV